MNAYYKDNKPHSFIWTNGNNISCYKYEKAEKLEDISFLSFPQTLKYAKLVDLEESKSCLIQEMLCGLALSEYHYFILHPNCLTVMSRITEKVVCSYDVTFYFS